MEKYGHISEMEAILDSHNDKIGELNEILDFLVSRSSDYRKLVEYYYSDGRKEDLEDDRKGLIDAELKRGVLSEDAIYNLMTECYAASIKMLELSTVYLKHG